MTQTTAPHGVPLDASRSPLAGFRRMRGREFQWWLAVMMAIIGWMLFQVIVSDEYREAWTAIKPGMQTTLYLTVLSFVVAVPLGLIIGMGRLSKNRFLNTISQVYIEFLGQRKRDGCAIVRFERLERGNQMIVGSCHGTAPV